MPKNPEKKKGQKNYKKLQEPYAAANVAKNSVAAWYHPATVTKVHLVLQRIGSTSWESHKAPWKCPLVVLLQSFRLFQLLMLFYSLRCLMRHRTSSLVSLSHFFVGGHLFWDTARLSSGWYLKRFTRWLCPRKSLPSYQAQESPRKHLPFR